MHRRQQHDLIDLAAFYHPHWRNDAQNKQINKQTEKKKKKKKKTHQSPNQSARIQTTLKGL